MRYRNRHQIKTIRTHNLRSRAHLFCATDTGGTRCRTTFEQNLVFFSARSLLLFILRKWIFIIIANEFLVCASWASCVDCIAHVNHVLNFIVRPFLCLIYGSKWCRLFEQLIHFSFACLFWQPYDIRMTHILCVMLEQFMIIVDLIDDFGATYAHFSLETFHTEWKRNEWILGHWSIVCSNWR